MLASFGDLDLTDPRPRATCEAIAASLAAHLSSVGHTPTLLSFIYLRHKLCTLLWDTPER